MGTGDYKLKIKNRIGKTAENSGQICGECLHAISNHIIIIDTKDKKYFKMTCTKCKSRKCCY